jgi:hypothetical protein
VVKATIILVGDNGNPFGAPLADTDTAAFSGRLRNYTITHNADGTSTVTDKVGKDGADTLLNIERLQFSDRSILVDGGLNLKEPSTANSATHDPAADFAEVGDASTDAQPTGTRRSRCYACSSGFAIIWGLV